MAGQGGPKTSQGRTAAGAANAAAGWGCRCALWGCLVLLPRGLAAETMQIRIAWGGGTERLWQGTVSLDRGGILTEARPLGIEADEPGSMWLKAGQLAIQQQSVRAYDGVDVLVTAPREAKLLIEFNAADGPELPIRMEVPLSELVGGFSDNRLDDQGNRLFVRRTPGDRLRVGFDRRRLIFSPPDDLTFDLTLEPQLLPLPSGSKVQVKVELADSAGTGGLWASEHSVWAGRPVSIPLKVELPWQEGVYELIITAARPANWHQPFRRPQPVAQRRIQLLVLGPDGPVPSARTEGKLTQVGEIDPANPAWHEKLRLDKLPTLPNFPRLGKPGPLGNGHAKTRQHALGEKTELVTELGPSAQSPDVSWEAYTLPIDRPGRPHVLEVDYPSDVPQTLGISVLEPNAAGELIPIGLDSGVDRCRELIGGERPARWLRHRLIFWPRTATPMVLMTNRRQRSPAVYGKIRVLAGWDRLPRDPAAGPRRQGERLLAAYLDRPLFPENFSARESLDAWSGRSLDDWQTFYEGGSRLVEYLNWAGYNGLMMSVLADGSTVYPSKVLQPTPRYDKGVFFATGQDPVRKDVLEMLLRLFDREGLQLIPAIDFAAPLPELEAIRRQGGPAAEAIQWIGPDGVPWCRTHPPRRGLAPYYNVLNPRVQEAMLLVVRELLQRCADHDSFGGLALQLSGHGYAQLPGPTWGMDDATIARFQQQTNLQVPGAAADRFAQRATFLDDPKYRPLWLQWRAAELSRFYRRVLDEVSAVRPEGRLYLAGAGALAGPKSQAKLRPTLPQRATMAEALLEVGINARHFQTQQRLVLLRPERLAPAGDPDARAINLEIGQMSDVDDYFRGVSVGGSLFFHQPQEVRVESFDKKSPFKSTYTWLVAQPVPSHRQNRRRIVHSLATLDSQVLVDGGWMLPMGQEESVRDLVAAYRQLPATRFRRVLDRHGADSSQPVTFRSASHAGKTYIYVVNDAPFATTAWVRVDAPANSRLRELTGLRQISSLRREAGGTFWEVELGPYDLVAVELPTADVQVSDPQVLLARTLETALGQRIQELADRVASLPQRDQLLSQANWRPPLDALDNPGFELPSPDGKQIPGWVTVERGGANVRIDRTQQHGGNQSVRITSTGPAAGLVSRSFAAPTTGRVLVSVWLRVADKTKQPSLQLTLEGDHAGEHFYRWFEIGAAPGAGQVVTPIGTNFELYFFPTNDLPLEGLSQLSMRFDLIGPGAVWIDDVQLFDLAFSKQEVNSLTKLLQWAHVTLQNGKVGDCMRLLDGYWPQFLEENVPLRSRLARRSDPSAPPPAETPQDSPGFMDRMKGFRPKWLRK